MMKIDNLVEAVRRPECLAELDRPGWEKFLHFGRLYGVSGRWYGQLESLGLLASLPPSVENHLSSDRLVALEYERRARWETDRVQHALDKLNIRFVLLKGAAYIMLGLSTGAQRVSSDLDILVPFDRLNDVETSLKEHGWRSKVEDDYDEHYYREWMHELPPMQHNVRGTWLDVHHNLVPRTSRLCPGAESLLQRAVPIEGTRYYALCPADMLIHSILHGFYNGEFLNGFRDILDVHELVTDLQKRHSSFWTDFIDRVEALNTGRPVYYALRYAKRFFDTQIPADVLETLASAAPNPIIGALMDFAIEQMVLHTGRTTIRERWAAQLLLARSHWIKMPPWMFVKYFSCKFAKCRVLEAEIG